MTSFEWLYRTTRPFEHPLYQHVWRQLMAAVRAAGKKPRVLDVGGRRSNYTIGLPGSVTITELPRETENQHDLDLGATGDMILNVLRRRSNVTEYVIDDMTETKLRAGSFDVVAAVEVLEHVEDDEAFVEGVAQVLGHNGIFLMTTPNGDYIPDAYPQHVRHYRRDQLEGLLQSHFTQVEVSYKVNDGWLFSRGLHRWSLRTPFRTLASMLAFASADLIERLGVGGKGPDGKLHLVAVCQEPTS